MEKRKEKDVIIFIYLSICEFEKYKIKHSLMNIMIEICIACYKLLVCDCVLRGVTSFGDDSSSIDHNLQVFLDIHTMIQLLFRH